MTTEYDGKIFSNEDLKVGDLVFPIGNGKILENGRWKFNHYDFSEVMSGYPDEPHKIVDLSHSTYKPYEVRTSHGYGPIEMYYKIIEKEVADF